MSFETSNNVEGSKLNPIEKEMYEKCISMNPGLTEDDWLELRESALSVKNPGAQKFFAIHGLYTNEKPDADTIEELNN